MNYDSMHANQQQPVQASTSLAKTGAGLRVTLGIAAIACALLISGAGMGAFAGQKPMQVKLIIAPDNALAYAVLASRVLERVDQLADQNERLLARSGTRRLLDMGATDTYTVNRRFEYENLVLATGNGAVTSNTTLNGWQNLSQSSALGFRARSDITDTVISNCGSAQDRYNGHYQVTTSGVFQGGEMLIRHDGEFVLSGTAQVQGSFGMTTVDPLYYGSIDAPYPYFGRIRITAVDGSSVTLRYVNGGMFVNDRFYSWDLYEASVDEASIEQVACLAMA